MVEVVMPGRNPFVGGTSKNVVAPIEEIWQQLYALADEIETVEALMERQASWICRNRTRNDLAVYQAKWDANDRNRLALHAQIEQLIWKADKAMMKATDDDRLALGHLKQDGGKGIAEWFASFVPHRDITASWCPEPVSCDGHEF